MARVKEACSSGGAYRECTGEEDHEAELMAKIAVIMETQPSAVADLLAWRDKVYDESRLMVAALDEQEVKAWARRALRQADDQ